MKGIIRTVALSAVLLAGTGMAAMAQGVNNTGYDRNGPYYGYGDRGYGHGNQGYGGYYGNRGSYGYDRTGPIEGAANVVGGALNAAGNIAGAAVNTAGNIAQNVLPPYGDRYEYYGDPYRYGYGSSYQPRWGSGGGAAYDRGYNRGY